MKKLLLSLALCLMIGKIGLAVDAVGLKIGYVNINKVINVSNEGKRKKKMLEAQFAQTQKMLKTKDEELRAKEKELKENIMLNAAMKAEKKAEIEKLRNELREELTKAQNSIRQDEQRITANILKELITVINKVAAEEKYDLIVEFNIKQAILYSKFNFIDVTDKVTEEYNKIQSLQ